jgi:hypothetical protein
MQERNAAGDSSWRTAVSDAISDTPVVVRAGNVTMCPARPKQGRKRGSDEWAVMKAHCFVVNAGPGTRNQITAAQAPTATSAVAMMPSAINQRRRITPRYSAVSRDCRLLVS